MNPHYQHIISIVIIILVVGGIYGFRLRRITKQGGTKKIRLRTMVILFIILIYSNFVRIVSHESLAIPLILTWLLPFIISALACYHRASQYSVQKDEKTGHYLVPNHLYKRLLYMLIPYGIFVLVLVLAIPTIAANDAFLYITTFTGGIISGVYMGYGIGFIVKGRRSNK